MLRKEFWKSWKTKDWGLAVFLGVQIVTVIALFFDLYLHNTDKPTITMTVREHQFLGVLILLFNAVGIGGLALHFFPPKSKVTKEQIEILKTMKKE